MNTRRKLVQAKPEHPSTQWHLMKESFYPIFEADKRAHVEYWYNMAATGMQRDQFRAICKGIYEQDPAKPDPAYAAALTETVEKEEVRLLLKNYGVVLSDSEGKPKAQTWLLHCGTSRRDRNGFRSVFAGCGTSYERRSVMHTDYVAPEAENYAIDRTHFVRSVDWNSLKSREEMQALEAERRACGGAVASDLDKRPSLIEAERRNAEHQKPRTTKPKNQFDGVNVLATLGYTDAPAEEVIARLKAKREADRDAEWYYVDKDGCTVYKAKGLKGHAGGPAAGTAAGSGEDGGILSTVTREPMTRWVTKTCD
ncbi:hypothetical protein ABB37_04444 [Leptomonas pyrrhocoris]|uniref:Uncharacterized protein n=1 Tax=Leptomonas pyrrhocoris TaxID=157538 RepID=A0A0M9G2Z6_LEPPY|nr:hypothetical protein ABB37_04444 [Leptomonas pyrrhocoris]KPA81086.1 hypothetical protein ABB37_04444 [Leptomonas pyrrhocoris]|eukprot:XP_015659525.1 hypothetical protein ABB37_04444 [Leptomonas pyrrhocoris]